MKHIIVCCNVNHPATERRQSEGWSATLGHIETALEGADLQLALDGYICEACNNAWKAADLSEAELAQAEGRPPRPIDPKTELPIGEATAATSSDTLQSLDAQKAELDKKIEQSLNEPVHGYDAVNEMPITED